VSLDSHIALLEGIAKQSDCRFLRGVLWGIAYAQEAAKQEPSLQPALKPTAPRSTPHITGQKASWDRLTPEQRQSRIERMMAGRRGVKHDAPLSPVVAPAMPLPMPLAPTAAVSPMPLPATSLAVGDQPSDSPIAAAFQRAVTPPIPLPAVKPVVITTPVDTRSKQDQANDLFSQGKPAQIVAAHIKVSVREVQQWKNKWEAERLLS